MDILKSPKSYLIKVGILPIPEENIPIVFRKYKWIFEHLHIPIVLLFLMSYSCSVFYVLFFKAKNVAEYSESILFCAAAAMRLSLYFVLIRKRSELPTLFESLENLVNESKQNKNCL